MHFLYRWNCSIGLCFSLQMAEEYLYKDVCTEFYQGNTTVYENDTDIKFNSKASVLSASKMSLLIRFSYQF